MTDIVLRLIAAVDPAVNEPLDRLLGEAADEIERLRVPPYPDLREECANLEAMNRFHEENIAKMTDEIDRLRKRTR